MSLKSKVILILLSVFILYGTVDYGIQVFLILPSFMELERYEAQQNLDRAVSAIQREIEYLDFFCNDWAAWDDTYEFADSLSINYIESNLLLSTFVKSSINLIYFYDTQGKPIWGKVYDLDTKETLHLPIFLEPGLPKRHSLIPRQSEQIPLAETRVSGILMTEQGPMLISSHPILTSNNEGPIQGTLMMGRFLNQSLIASLVNQTRVDFEVILNPADLLPELKGELLTNLLTKESPYQIKEQDDNRLLIYTHFTDINGHLAFLIRVKIPRKIVERGFVTIRYALISILVSGLIVLIVMMLLLQKTILSPLLRLTSHVLSVRTHTDFSMRLALERRDEIGTLAREFDRMLEKIEQQTMALEVVNEQLRDDITKRQQAEKALQKANHELQRLVTLDGLTQIPNRRRFEEHINQEWKRARRDKKPISLIMCDVDYFKLYNDTYGHQLGDDCLRAIAKTICQNVKRPSDLAARYGGEEFVVILPETDSNGAVHVAQRIRFQVEQLQMEHKNSLAHQYVTLSLGISTLIPSPNLPRERLIALADKALYEAKKQGRNRAILEANPKNTL